jgi:dihydroneopterin aldolase
MNGDVIHLEALAVECVIGFIDWERRVKQTVLVDLDLPVDCAHAARTDDVRDTLDYKSVSKRVTAFVAASECMLVETLAQRLAITLLREFGMDWVRIAISKPGAIRGSKNVGVRIERRRQDLLAQESVG